MAVTRAWLYDKGVLKSQRYEVPVICVGNLAVGGTGKTPHVEYLLRLLHNNGYRVAMLSRGYGRRTKGYILADAARHTAADIGDEPYQILHNCPFATVAVCERRVYGIDQLLKLSTPPDVIVLDDAYQHRQVRAGLNILLTCANRLYTHDHLLPWGRLREPAHAARRAQLVVVTKCAENERPPLPVAEGQRLFYSQVCYGVLQRLDGSAVEPEGLGAKRVLLVAGIANPAPLKQYLAQMGAEVTLAEFRDHHAFTPTDAKWLARLWHTNSCQLAVTTQKDVERLRQIAHSLPQPLVDNLLVQPIVVNVEAARTDDKSFNQTILDYVRTNKRNCCVD